MSRAIRSLVILLGVISGVVIVGQPLRAEEAVHNEVIIVADDPPAPPTPVVAAAPTASDLDQPAGHLVPGQRGEIYGAVWHHPEQTFVDSEIGPLPLWTETVYDENGNPRPRFPDVFTKAFLDNPSDETAMAYLESQRVRARRYLQASQIMQRVAVDMGYVTPDAFRTPQTQSPNSRALVPPYNMRRQDWGTPVLTPEQARTAGLTKADVPETPGKTTTRDVEMVMFWDHRCPYSMRGFRDYAELGEEIYKRELGPRVMTISLDNDTGTTKAQLEFLEYTGVPTKHIENWLDQTELATAMNVQYTPTYVLIDRRTGKLLRFEGIKDKEFLRAQLLDLVGHHDDSWDQVEAAWFRPTAPAPGAKRPAADPERAPPPGATPVQRPSRTVRAWDPDGVQDR